MSINHVSRFGWRVDVEKFKMLLLTGGHQTAQELPAGLVRAFDLFCEAVRTKNGSMLRSEIEQLSAPTDDRRMLHEPTKFRGWNIKACMYRKVDELWWLVHAERHNLRAPSAKEVAWLDKFLEVLGGNLADDQIFGPNSSPENEAPLFFGWWTWRNVSPLYEMQINKAIQGPKCLRIVRLGTPESDGYVSLPPTRSR